MKRKINSWIVLASMAIAISVIISAVLNFTIFSTFMLAHEENWVRNICYCLTAFPVILYVIGIMWLYFFQTKNHEDKEGVTFVVAFYLILLGACIAGGYWWTNGFNGYEIEEGVALDGYPIKDLVPAEELRFFAWAAQAFVLCCIGYIVILTIKWLKTK